MISAARVLVNIQVLPLPEANLSDDDSADSL